MSKVGVLEDLVREVDLNKLKLEAHCLVLLEVLVEVMLN